MFGYINMSREAYLRMKQRKNGTGAASVILNVIGAGGVRPTSNYIAGATANAGLIAFTEALGAEAAADAIRVVGVNPGMVHVIDIHASMRFNAPLSDMLFADTCEPWCDWCETPRCHAHIAAHNAY
eukprot:COSAG02_NODE_1639_length_11532_cov_11.198461_3_plen_126_part_00